MRKLISGIRKKKSKVVKIPLALVVKSSRVSPGLKIKIPKSKTIVPPKTQAKKRLNNPVDNKFRKKGKEKKVRFDDNIEYIPQEMTSDPLSFSPHIQSNLDPKTPRSRKKE